MFKFLVVLSALVAAATSFIPPNAVVGIVPGENTQISGTLYLATTIFGVSITGMVRGLSPGDHGFHIHEYGATANKCMAAGGHFNPLRRSHGGPNDAERHAGDLGNINANLLGDAFVNIMDNHISLDPNSQTYVGNLAFVIHAGVDDLGKGGNAGSLATGNAGGRDGCGLIMMVDSLLPFYRTMEPYAYETPRLGHGAVGPTSYYTPYYYHK